MDDTDNLESVGTGHVVEDFRKALALRGVETQSISRHQLYFHQDVPYTSHNSSMCTEMDIPKEDMSDLIALAIEHLQKCFVEGSDPGLCVACLEDIPDVPALIAYGRRGKNSLLTKDEAYQMAGEQNIHLSEHGGTGQGVVGALAGVALRIFGFDGRVKGKVKAGEDGERLTVAELLQRTGFAQILAVDGTVVRDSDIITLNEGRVKAVRLNWQSTIVVTPVTNGVYSTLVKKLLKAY